MGTITVVINLGLFMALYFAAEPLKMSHNELLEWASICTFIAFSVGLILGLFFLVRAYGSIIPIPTALRVLGVSVVLIVLGRQLPQLSLTMTILVAIIVGLGYLIGLFLTQEFGDEDKARLAKVIRRKRT